MKYLSRSSIIKSILASCQARATISAIAGNRLSGKTHLARTLYRQLSALRRTVVIRIQAKNVLTKSAMIEQFSKTLELELGIEKFPEVVHLDVYQAMFTLVNAVPKTDLDRLILLIQDFGDLSLEQQYVLAAQLRNLREKTRSEARSLDCHSIYLGNWRPLLLKSQSIIHMGSAPFEDCYLIDSLSPAELDDLFETRASKAKLAYKAVHVEYLFEMSGGCFGIVSRVLKSLQDNITCQKIRELAESDLCNKIFLEELKKIFRNLSPQARDIIYQLLKGHFVPWDSHSELLEELYFSGLVRRESRYGREIMELRSWPHELALRTYARGLWTDTTGEKICTRIEELIPPVAALNRHAYHIVMEIENLLRNLLIKIIAEKSPNKHPFKQLDAMGVKAYRKQKEMSYYDWCQDEKKRLLGKHFVEAHSSLSSYLSMSDLKKIFTNDFSGNGLLKDIGSILGKYDQVHHLLNRLNTIRNPIAHNNLISEKTVDELINIANQIYGLLTIKH